MTSRVFCEKVETNDNESRHVVVAVDVVQV